MRVAYIIPMLRSLALVASFSLSLVVGCAAPTEEDVGEGQGASTGTASSGEASREPGPIADMAEAQVRFKASKCLMCHGFERKVLGPSFRTIADDYAARLAKRTTEREKAGLREQTVTKYVKSVRGGSQYNWNLNGLPMPANPDVSEAEARRLVDFVLDLPAP